MLASQYGMVLLDQLASAKLGETITMGVTRYFTAHWINGLLNETSDLAKRRE